jgi:hypothetical protein
VCFGVKIEVLLRQMAVQWRYNGGTNRTVNLAKYPTQQGEL